MLVEGQIQYKRTDRDLLTTGQLEKGLEQQLQCHLADVERLMLQGESRAA